jgi:hypothetical protein
MHQIDSLGKAHFLPSNRAAHIRFGDEDNPEGIAVLEAVHRLERYQNGLEIVLGIGMEHTAGHLSVTFDEGYQGSGADESDENKISTAARNIMSAQESSYAVWPPFIKGEIMDSPFAAAEALLNAIRYFGHRKLQLINMQWVAMSTTSGTGSYASMQDSSAMSVITLNAMMEGFVEQLNKSYVDWLFRINKDSFPDLTQKPKLVATKARKDVSPDEIGKFLEVYGGMFPLGEQDLIQIRKQSGVLLETLPADDEIVEPRKKDEPKEEKPKEPKKPEKDTDEDDAEEDIKEDSIGFVQKIVTGVMSRLKRNNADE